MFRAESISASMQRLYVAEAARAITGGIMKDASPIFLTIRGLLACYLRDSVLQPATIRSFTSFIDMLVAAVGDLPVQQVDSQLVLQYRRLVLARGVAPSTWNTYLTHLRTVWNYGVREKLIDENPFRGHLRVPVAKVRKKTVSVELLQRALVTLDDRDALQPAWFWGMVLRMFYFTGMRRRQLISLHWEHADLNEGTLILAAAGSKTRREWTIPLAEEIIDDLEELQRRTVRRLQSTDLHRRQMFNVTLWNERYRGTEMTVDHVWSFFRRLGLRLGEPITPHRLRHTTATQLMRTPNRDVRTVQALLGHTDIRTTLGYVEPDLDQMRQVLRGLKPIR